MVKKYQSRRIFVTKVFCLLKVEVGEEKEVIKNLLAIPEIIRAHIVTGEYDIIVELNGESFADLKVIVLENIRKIANIKQTLTCPALEL